MALQDPTFGAHSENGGQVWQGGSCLLDQKTRGGKKESISTLVPTGNSLKRYHGNLAVKNISHSLESYVIFPLVLYLEDQLVLLKDLEGSKVQTTLCNRSSTEHVSRGPSVDAERLQLTGKLRFDEGKTAF